MSNTDTIDSLPALVSAHFSTSKANWETEKPGVQRKLLFDNPATGERAVLAKIEAGMRSPPHAHKELEHVYVLSGSFFDDDHLMQAGDYCCRAPGTVHSGGTDEGALILSVYAAVSD